MTSNMLDSNSRVGKSLQWGQQLFPWVVVTLLTLPATLYLWYPGLQTTYDGLYHKSRFFELDWLLRSGIVYPRWLPHVNFGYGSPTLHFYSPLIYYVCEVFHLMGFGYLTAYEIMIGLGVVAAGWSMFALARRWGTTVGWLAAAVYVYWPYHIELAYIRGAQAELWAMVWFPLLVLSVVIQTEEKGKPWWKIDLGLAATYAALILTHHLSAFAFTPLLAVYAFWRALAEKNARSLVRVALSMLLGGALAALYWLPVLADISLVWAGRPAAEEREALLRVLVPLRDVLSPFWLHHYYPEQGVKAPSPIPRLGVVLWVAAGILTLMRPRNQRRPFYQDTLFFGSIPVVVTFMFTVYSRWFWANIPLIHYLQFPWRLHSLMGFSLALFVALGASALLGKHSRGGTDRSRTTELRRISAWGALGATSLTILLALTSLSNIHYDIAKEPLSNRPLRERDVDLRLIAAYDYLRGLFIREFRDVWLFEYMPVWSASARDDFFLPPDRPPASEEPLSVDLRVRAQAPLDRTFRVRSPQPWTFSLHQFYFPAWDVYLDGKRITPRPEGELGLLAVDVPAGEHLLRITYGHTHAQRVGEAISLIALLVWLGVAVRRRSRWLVVPVLVAIYLAIATAPAWLLEQGTFQPAEQDVLLGDRIRLVGSYIPRAEARRGERAWFALYWFALAPPEKRYKVIVHLTDLQGNTVANGDTEPWFFFTPTTRWQQGELMEDWYFVDVPDDLPPGQYLLLTGMYDPETIQNLPAQGGRMLGGRIVVGELKVK